ncbi:MAG: hypothetical protein M2R45_04020 [Verrucomicrobia subdivision 3 bacterium]|nr:hypothetical protein [Limisphaerales bacterium]MCS1416229.1 hypothetical protein [Limisphaerales bacterium]
MVGLLTSSLQFRAEADQECIITLDGFNQHEGTALLTWSLDRANARDVHRFGIVPTEIITVPGGTAQFIAQFRGPRPPDVALQWFRNGELIPDEAGPSITIENVSRPLMSENTAMQSMFGDIEVISESARLRLTTPNRRSTRLTCVRFWLSTSSRIYFSFGPANAQPLAQQRRRPIPLVTSLATGFSDTQMC